jgi:hypothetical protein
LGILVVVQLGVQIWALVDLIRRPAERVKGSKWLWGALIVFLSNLALGAILYFAIGRLPAPVDVAAPADASGGDRAQRAVDVLYGPEDDA